MSHTPGPWRAVSRSVGVGPLDDYNSDFLGWEIEGPPESTRGQFARGADARLIAAAPDMEEAGNTLAAYVYSILNPGEIPESVKSAMQVFENIARAEGRP